MDQFGKYRVLRRIGAGGFGVVYEGYDPAIRRRVAIKTCTSADPRVRQRFAREAEITGNLSHPNIVVVYDYGEIDGKPFLVQEFLVGEDLDAKIARPEPLPLAQKVGYLIQIAEALCHAHRSGVVHRDVKPSNVRVLDTGVVKVMDFGIAWIKNQESITLTGRAVGTAAFMAPEQLRNEPIGPQADIFSFGVLAYELLTGERAFAGDTQSQVLYQVLNVEPVPLRARNPQVPEELAALVAGCYRKDPEERYRSLDPLLPALYHLAAPTEARGVDAPPRARRVAAGPARDAPPAPARAAPSVAHSRERTVALRPPPPPRSPSPSPPPAPGPATSPSLARLDSVDLRGSTSPASRGTPLARAAAARRRPRSSTPVWVTVLVLVAVVAVVAPRWSAIAPLLPSSRLAAGTPAPAVPTTDRISGAADTVPASDPAPLEPVATPAQTARAPGPPHQRDTPPIEPSPTHLAAEPTTAPEPGREASTKVAPAIPRDALPRANPPRATPARARGALSVRAALGSPQAWAWLDDRLLGRTPIRAAPVPPGSYRLRIALDPDGGDGAVTWVVRVARGQEVILTIDPVSAAPPREVRRPLSTP